MGEEADSDAIYQSLKDIEPNFQELADEANAILHTSEPSENSAVDNFTASKPLAERELISRRAMIARLGWAAVTPVLAVGGTVGGFFAGMVLPDSKYEDYIRNEVLGVDFDLSSMLDAIREHRRKPSFKTLFDEGGDLDERVRKVLQIVARFDSGVNPVSQTDFDEIDAIRACARDSHTHAFMSGLLVDIETRQRVRPETLRYFDRDYVDLPYFARVGIVQKNIGTRISTVGTGIEKDSRQWGLDGIVRDFNDYIGSDAGVTVSGGDSPQFLTNDRFTDEEVVNTSIIELQTSGFYSVVHMAQFVAANPLTTQTGRREVWDQLLAYIGVARHANGKHNHGFDKAIWNAASVMATQSLEFDDIDYFKKFADICVPADDSFWSNPTVINDLTVGRANSLDTMVVGFALTLFASQDRIYNDIWNSNENPLGMRKLHSRVSEVRQLEFSKRISFASTACGIPASSGQSLSCHLVDDGCYALYAPSVSSLIGRTLL